jgi:hypothetical protein
MCLAITIKSILVGTRPLGQGKFTPVGFEFELFFDFKRRGAARNEDNDTRDVNGAGNVLWKLSRYPPRSVYGEIFAFIPVPMGEYLSSSPSPQIPTVFAGIQGDQILQNFYIFWTKL